MTRRWPWLVLLALLAGACGDDDSGDEPADGNDDGARDAGGDADSGDGDGDGDAPEAACGDLGAGEHMRMLEIGGEEREYTLVIPELDGDADPAPFVVNMHGFTSNAIGQQGLIGMDSPEAWSDYVIAYPEGLDASWNAGTDCCGMSQVEDRDDVAFIRALVEEVSALPCVDDTRVYATGMSNGGFMSYRLACEASELFAAVAPVVAQLGMPPEDCQPSRPVPVMAFNGTGDEIVPYSGEETSLAAVPGIADNLRTTAESIGRFAEIHGCDETTSTTFSGDTTTCESHDGCGDGEVILCTAEEGGHCWPGVEECPFGNAVVDISASEAMTEFFARHSL